MNRPSQLTKLIWDFYRENQKELRSLKILNKCKVFRSWGVLHIRCFSEEIAAGVLSNRDLLVEPVAQLRLANKIKISVKKRAIATFPVHSDKLFA
ncbi:MAG: hypothetical protein SAJ37_16360 [Oscillatoria sp. PMC 1068.18]|nr:hypothetical protein [Oscillatoria sp. PMC 1076.18]MEC4990305.1 hypothetical protein [Oscillatoria sp. PMC 1068.18]